MAKEFDGRTESRVCTEFLLFSNLGDTLFKLFSRTNNGNIWQEEEEEFLGK